MNHAFEVSEIDVQTACERHLGLRLSLDECDEYLKRIDTGVVEKAALYGNDMDAQTDYAIEEIAKQLKEFPEFARATSLGLGLRG